MNDQDMSHDVTDKGHVSSKKNIMINNYINKNYTSLGILQGLGKIKRLTYSVSKYIPFLSEIISKRKFSCSD